MEVITIESPAFKEMAGQIAEIAGLIREIRKCGEQMPTDRLLDTEEASRMLGACKRTLQRMRDEHRIEYAVIRGKCKYRLSEVQRLLADCTVKGNAATLGELYHDYALRAGGRKPAKERRK